jgi:hypothetical protein
MWKCFSTIPHSKKKSNGRKADHGYNGLKGYLEKRIQGEYWRKTRLDGLKGSKKHQMI